MKDDELLRRIGEALGGEDHLDDPRFERLAAGELDQQQVEELRRDLLARPQPPDPESLDAAIQALAPLDPAIGDRVAARFLQQAEARPAEKKAGWFAWLRGWRMLTAGVAAAAAAVLLLILWPGAVPDLPAYRMEPGGGDRLVRGDEPRPDKTPVLRPGSLLTIRLRPATRPDDPGSVALIAWLEQGDSARRIRLEHRVSESGTVLIEQPVGDLQLRPGPARLALVVVPRGAEERVPDVFGEILAAGDSGKPWQVFVLDMEYRERT